MRVLHALAIVAALAACAPPATQILFTPEVPTATPAAAPLDLSPPLELGSRFLYEDGTTLVAVPSGPFVMGHGTADNPEHKVTLSGFWIYATKVTNHQYSLCEAQGRCPPPDLADNLVYADFDGQNDPVVGVTYAQAAAYCSYVNGTLPTEAQWEKAARGPDANLYPWGNADPSCTLLNFNNCQKHTTEVNQYEAGKSYYGALDMAGNVYEWTADWFDPLYYESSPPSDPLGPDSGRARVIRASGYRSNATQSSSYARAYTSPGDHRRDLGFRCVVRDPTYFAPACQLASVVGTSELASAVIDCPVISIDVQTTACKYGGGAVVTFNNDHPQDPNASFGGIIACKLLSGKPGLFPLSYECRAASTALLSSGCTYSGISDGQCPPHYKLSSTAGVCQWEGSRSSGLDCPTGKFYDPVSHCCLISSGHLADYPVCPVGMVFTDLTSDHYACMPAASVRNVPSQEKSINPPVCPNTCNLTTEICGQRNLVFCPTTCGCLSVGVKCPTN